MKARVEMSLARSVLIGVVLLSLGLNSLAVQQNGQWIWIDGSSTVNSHSTDNNTEGIRPYPGARHGTTAWTDDDGRVWMFGGEGYGLKNPNKLAKSLAELWIFDIESKKWSIVDSSNETWPSPCVDCVSCSHKNHAVVYGGVAKRKGIPNFRTWVLNMTTKRWVVLEEISPTPRQKSVYWCDRNQGALWLYGGEYSSKDLNDMWHFSFSTMKWHQIKIPQNLTTPNARFSSMSWIHYPDHLYLFGGHGLGSGLLSDLWVFSTNASSWELVKGSSRELQVGVYGMLGIPSAGTMPGCREGSSTWTDDEGNLWLFGGRGCDIQTTNTTYDGLLSDLWMFNTSSSLWTWVGGPSRRDGEAFYGAKGVYSPHNMPRPREATMTFRNGSSLWVFGGYGRDKDNAEGLLNDMWVYSNANSPSLGPPSHGLGLPGDTLDMSYTYRVMLAFGILTMAMVISLLLCYRKECNIMYWRYKKGVHVPRAKYEPLKVKMQVPEV